MPRKFVRNKSGSLHQAVAEDIGARILKGEYAPGTLLPNEASWCKTYHVSRTAVREAIKMLAAKGLIVSRTKIGSRVQPRERWNLLDRDMLGWYCSAMDPRQFLADIQQVRLILEPEAAALAAVNRTEEQMQAIEVAMRAMWEARSHEEVVASDVNFHLSILAAAGNELLVPFGFLIESALANLFDYTVRRTDDWKYAAPLHANIVKAIRQKKPAAARLAVRSLLNDTDRIIDRVAAKRLRARRQAKIKASA
jgi:DNA-binding FadR family transcriptional regulator